MKIKFFLAGLLIAFFGLAIGQNSFAALLTDSTFTQTTEGFTSGGALNAASTNFQTYANLGSVIGATADGTLNNGSGLAYSLFSIGGVTGVSTGTTATVDSSGGLLTFNQTAGPVTVDIPPGAFTSTVTVTVLPTAPTSCKFPPGQTILDTGVGIQVTISSGIEPSLNVTISISYAQATLPSGVDKSQLQIARCDADVGVWIPLVSNDDVSQSIVSAQSDRFSTFDLMGVSLPSSVKDIEISNNPIRPSQGITNTTFSNLPANSRLRIYTISGLLVKSITADATGVATWDATNQSGRMVASGIYFIYVQGNGSKKTLTIVVQR